MHQFAIRQMLYQDIDQVIKLQKQCFPPPFSEDLIWKHSHLERHLSIFPEGQFVALDSSSKQVIGSASCCRISESCWNQHKGWEETLGGFFFESYDPNGTTLYGADISVHPDYRKCGIGKQFYQTRFALVKQLQMVRYGTACRIPDYSYHNSVHNGSLTVQEYCRRVALFELNDRTLTPFLKMGLSFLDVIEDYMDDLESGNAAALLEWRPK